MNTMMKPQLHRQPSFLTLPSGRLVLDTGRLHIGARAGEQSPRLAVVSADAQRLQDLLRAAAAPTAPAPATPQAPRRGRPPVVMAGHMHPSAWITPAQRRAARRDESTHPGSCGHPRMPRRRAPVLPHLSTRALLIGVLALAGSVVAIGWWLAA
jgi:hypothetical protein